MDKFFTFYRGDRQYRVKVLTVGEEFLFGISEIKENGDFGEVIKAGSMDKMEDRELQMYLYGEILDLEKELRKVDSYKVYID